MKKIKVFALPSHQSKERTSGVDFVRVLQPMHYLNGYKDEEVEFETTMYDINVPTDWLWVAKNFDVIYFNYLNNPWGFAAMGAMARKFGVKLVMDLDDSLWDLKADNPAYEVYKKGSQALSDFTAICNEVDAITVTNLYLKHIVMKNTLKRAESIHVFPNYIDLDLYSHRAKFKNYGNIKLFHYGSTTHFQDLSTNAFYEGIDRIMKEYPNVTLTTVGAFLPKYRERWGLRYENSFGHRDIYKWVKNHFPKCMDQADIMVVPLVDDTYNRCKSQIKWLEASSAGIPGVWQDIRQYREVIKQGENGFLAKYEDDWYKSIKEMIDSPELREKMAKKTHEDVKNWQIQDHVGDYAKFLKKLLAS